MWAPPSGPPLDRIESWLVEGVPIPEPTKMILPAIEMAHAETETLNTDHSPPVP